MKRLTVLIGWLWALAGAAAQTVEFPLDYYSFAEIAQRMSVGGRTVQCARDLQQRLALIHLKPREWQQARALLEHALDIRLRKTSDAENRWILERDPETVRRERQLREQLARYLEQQLQGGRDIMQKQLDKNTPIEDAVREMIKVNRLDEPPYAGDVEQTRAVIKEMVQFMRTAPIEQAMRNWRSYAALNRDQQAFNAARQGVPSEAAERQFLETHPLQRYGFSIQELQWAQQQAAQPSEFLKRIIGISGEDLPEDPVVIQLHALQLLGAVAEDMRRQIAHTSLLNAMRPRITPLECIEQGVVERLYTVALPAEHVAWLLEDAEGKRITAPSNELIPLRLVAVGQWDGDAYQLQILILDPTLSDTKSAPGLQINPPVEYAWLRRTRGSYLRLLEAIDPDYARAYKAALEGHDALLQQELCRRPLKARPSRLQAWTEYARLWAQENQQEVIAEVLEVFRPMRESRTLQQSLEETFGQVLLAQREGVWMFRHWAAFVERIPDYPHAAIRDLMRSPRDYADWRRFIQAVRPEQIRWLMMNLLIPAQIPYGQATNERTLDLSDLAKGWIIMQILDALPPALRGRLWEQGEDEIAPPVPLAVLPDFTQRQLIQLFTQWRPMMVQITATSLNPYQLFYMQPIEAWFGRLQLHRRRNVWLLSFPTPTPQDFDQAFQECLLYSFMPAKPMQPESTPHSEDSPVR